MSFAIPKSAIGSGVSVSADISFVGLGSVVPTGGVTFAVFTKSPVAPAAISAVIVYTTEFAAPDSMSTNSEIFPEPEAFAIEALPLATAVHITFDKAAGILSVTTAPTTSVGPSLVTVTV